MIINESSQIPIDDYDHIVQWSYSLARKWVIENLVPQGVVSSRKFEEYKKKGNPLPVNFPRIPDEYFTRRRTWQGWQHFLGNPDNVKRKQYLPYSSASRVARSGGISNSVAYRKWEKRPGNLPARPELHYKEWKNWESFLGNRYKVEPPSHNSKLNEKDVRIIKHQLKLGVPGAVLARTFNVSEMQISRIKKGENWRDIEV